MQNFERKIMDGGKYLMCQKVFFCVCLWTIGPKHQNKILNMQATCVSLCVCESNRIFISFVWCRSFCPEIMILMITSTAQKNEKFPRNLYKFIDKKKKCHINCGFDFSSFPHFYTFRFCCFVYVRDVFSPPVSYVCVFLLKQRTNFCCLLLVSPFSSSAYSPCECVSHFVKREKKRILIGVSRLKKVMKMWEIF